METQEILRRHPLPVKIPIPVDNDAARAYMDEMASYDSQYKAILGSNAILRVNNDPKQAYDVIIANITPEEATKEKFVGSVLLKHNTRTYLIEDMELVYVDKVADVIQLVFYGVIEL